MGLVENAVELALWDDLVDRLRLHDVRYLSGGSSWHGRPAAHQDPRAIAVQPLMIELVQASYPRLRDALVALLFRHPEYAPDARAAADLLMAGERPRLLILASVAGAAALQRAWTFTLDIYLPHRHDIDADDLCAALGVPSPREDYGRTCLRALSALLARDQPFPFDYARAWEDVARHIVDDLRGCGG